MNPPVFGKGAGASLTRRSFLKASASLSAVTVLGTTACSDGGEASGEAPGDARDLSAVSRGAMPDFAAGQQFTATEDLTFTMMFPEWPEVPYKKDWLIWEELAKRTRVRLDCTIVPLSDYTDKRNLLVSSGDSPMLIPLTYVGEEGSFTSSGAVVPVSDYVDLMPNFKALIEEWDLRRDLDQMRQADGRFYLCPGVYEEPYPNFTMTFRMDVLEEEGLAVPETWDEFRTTLERLKDRYPDNYPFSDTYQGNATLNIAATAFGTVAGWGFGTGEVYDAESDSFVYAPATQQYKDLVSYFHGLVTDGLMDPESFTQDLEQAENKFFTGKSLVTNGNAENIPYWQGAMAGTLGENNFRISKIPVPAGPAGPLMGGGRLWHGFMLSAEAEQSPNFVAMLQFIDWLSYDMTAKELLIWGVEGATYTKDSSDVRTLTEDVDFQGLNPSGTKDLEEDYGFSLNLFGDGGTTDLVRSRMPKQELEFQDAMLSSREPAPQDPPAPFDEIEREQATLLSTPLKDTVDTRTLEFILGRRPMSEWDAFLGELQAQGLDTYLDLVNTAYKRFKEEHGG